MLIIPSAQRSCWGGYIGFTPSVRPSVRPACTVCPVTSAVLDGFFPYQAQMVTTMRGCVAHNDLWPWHKSSRSFSHDFVVKLLKYGTSCRVRSIACTVLDGFFPYLARMITSMRWCVAYNDLWPWPIASRLLSCDIAYFMDYIHMWHKYNPWGDNVPCTISRSTGQKSRSHRSFAFLQSGRGVS